MKLRYKILLLLILIILIFVVVDTIRVNGQQEPVFVLHVNTYKDGGTKIYYGIGYKVIQWNKAHRKIIKKDTLYGYYEGYEISYFPDFKTIGEGPSRKIGFVSNPLCQPTEISLRHFADTILVISKKRILDYDKQGLGGGIDGFNLIKVFDFKPHDFLNVVAKGGEYLVKDSIQFYNGNAASDSPVLTLEGMKTLLVNTAKRLKLPCDQKASVDSLMVRIRK